MKKNTPAPISYIRSFEAAARHLSFSRAAEELGYTQAAISTHVRSLEKYLGRTLFIRHARSIQLTEVGETFLPTLREALQQIDMATDAVVRTSREESLVVACPMSLAESWLPEVLETYRAQNPSVEIVVHGTVWENAVNDPADIAISIRREDEIPANCRRLIAEELILVCTPGLAPRIKRPEDVFSLPWILVSGRQEYFTIFARHHGLLGHTPTGQALRTNASNISMEMAAAGIGVTITLRTLAEPYLRRGLLVAPFDETYPSLWSYYLSLPSGRPSSSVRRLVDHMLAAAQA